MKILKKNKKNPSAAQVRNLSIPNPMHAHRYDAWLPSH